MNKAAIKRFAIEARNKLRNSVTDKAGMLGITPEECSGPVTTGPDFKVYQTAAGTEVTLNKSQCELRKKLVDKIAERGFDAVVEEVAYTWFNRICAIRFTEVNDYLPSRVRVLSSEKDGKNEPDLVTMAPDVDLPFTEEEREKIYDLKMKGTTAASDELFQKLFIKQCNALHEILPELFEETQDYTELLLDISYANKDDVIYMLVNQEDGIPEADFNVTSVNEQGEVTGQVEIIGWLYQYYNTELKDDTFAKLKKNIKITKERIPAATQLFTPDWIVRYMVENSVGRIWIDHLRALDPSVNEKETAEKFGWKYYLPEAKQEESVNVKLAEIRSNYKELKPTDILCIDPCMGSGHILIAMFDVLMDIYTSTGYSEREAAFEIVEHNIHGLDIDQRAYQLAYFAIMMKGRGYNRRFFRGRDDVKPMPKVYAIAESNDITRDHLSLFGQSMDTKQRGTAKEQMEYLLDTFKDGREYGSILNVEECDWKLLQDYVEDLDADGQITFESYGSEETQKSLRLLIKVAKNLGQKYDAVVTNPPYMGASNMNADLGKFIKDNYADYKSDFFSAFIVKCTRMAKKAGYLGFLTPYVWMFIQSYEKLRNYLFTQATIEKLIQFEYSAFEEATVPICTFVLKNSYADKKGCYLRLTDFRGGMEVQRQKTLEAISNLDCGYYYEQYAKQYEKIPGSPVAYWVSEEMLNAFEIGMPFEGNTKKGVLTGDNNKFLRSWYEISDFKIGFDLGSHTQMIESKKKWFPVTSGGEKRKWYGNYDTVVNLENDGYEIKNTVKNYRLRDTQYYMLEAVTWTEVSSGIFSCRYVPRGILFGNGGPVSFFRDKLTYNLAFLNSKVAMEILYYLAPTINYGPEQISKLPIIYSNNELVEDLSKKCVHISKMDWDSFEISWDFCKHPLMPQREEEGITIFAGMKIGEEKWIKKLENGSACFSPIADYIEKGEKENNNEQGDKYEGVFARLKKNDTRIHDMEDRLKGDLEEIEDGEYILLRRKSSRTVPVFCLYGFYKEDAQMIELSSNNVKLELIPSSKMYNEFLNGVSSTEEKKVAWTLFFSLGHLQQNIQTALDDKHVNYRFAKVQYDLFDGDEFFIEPTSDYPELTHKAKRLSYQKEIRWVLPNIHQSTKYILPYTPLKKESMGCHEGKTNFQFQAEAHIKEKVSIESCYNRWRNECDTRFAQLKANEEELNRIFIDIYGLQNELTPEVEDKDVTVRKADLGRDIRSFISYAVGCMFGRYSLDKDGLMVAGQPFESVYFEATAPRAGTGVAGAPGDYVPTGEFYIKTEDGTKKCKYNPDRDNIIPITDEEYFSDDIVGRFVEFVETVYGKDTLEENLDFIAQALGNKGNSSREVIRNYFIKDFYKDHLKVYQKRPIYWLFDSGKQNGFKALIYMHRYDADTVGRVRTDYLHRAQNYVETAMKSAEYTIENTTVASEKSKAMKAVSKYTKQLAEMQTYDQAIAHVANQRIEFDLDDGVKVNYAKFQGVEVAQEGKKALKVDLLAKI